MAAVNEMNGPTKEFIIPEYDPPYPSPQLFCNKMTLQDFENEGLEETKKELEHLASYLASKPGIYKEILKKRKIEELENSGWFSFIKTRILIHIQAEEFSNKLISEDDCLKKIADWTNTALKVFEYYQDEKAVEYSSRFAEKRKFIKENASINRTFIRPAARRQLHVETSSVKTPPRTHAIEISNVKTIEVKKEQIFTNCMQSDLKVPDKEIDPLPVRPSTPLPLPVIQITPATPEISKINENKVDTEVENKHTGDLLNSSKLSPTPISSGASKGQKKKLRTL